MQPDPERVCVAWARADAPLVALNSTRVATRLPTDENGNPTWDTSFLRVTLIDGTLVVAETGDIASAVVQFDAFAKTTGRSPNYTVASAIARQLIASAIATSGETFAGEGTLVGFGGFVGPRRFDEGDTGFARYTVDATCVVRA